MAEYVYGMKLSRKYQEDHETKGFPKFSREESLAIYHGELRWSDRADRLVPAKISAQPNV